MIIIERKDHCISRKDISQHALSVLQRLHEAGFSAYLVGGGVRDLLLGLHPKDFDIATDALPDEVAHLFHNCRLIGRRFRLAHIYFSRHIIEVATFRAAPHSDHPEHAHQQSAHGMILRDNVYGTLEEDAWRRDFTINALYYNIADQCVVDYTGGMADLSQRLIRVIGDPKTRYTEDPVRMLRAIRLSSKLNLAIEEQAKQPIYQYHHLLSNVSPSRLFDELQKIFQSGAALRAFEAMRHYGIFRYLFPTMDKICDEASGSQSDNLIRAALANTDKRIHSNKSVNPAFLIACFLWQPYLNECSHLIDQGHHPTAAKHIAIDRIIRLQAQTVTVPKRLSYTIRDIWDLQRLLIQRKRKTIYRMLERPRFRAAYDFLLLRTQAGETDLAPAASWWTQFQEASEHTRKQLLKTLKPHKIPK